jgi:hypothetical protein
MLKIERLSLGLPHDFAPRAANITHLVGDELSHFEWNKEGKITKLRLPILKILPNATDKEIAKALANAIYHGIHGEFKWSMD